eukprot:symbB.v1.2.003465.t1/scaffold149.1/size460148/4
MSRRLGSADFVGSSRLPSIVGTWQGTEGPQCQHLYKGTNLGKQRWTQTAKYFTELVEARRTTVDDFHYLRRLERGWIWMAIWPHTTWIWGRIKKKTTELEETHTPEPHELLSSDVVCGLSKHGPISSLRWVFFRRCECHH